MTELCKHYFDINFTLSKFQFGLDKGALQNPARADVATSLNTPYFHFCLKCNICNINTYERQKERRKRTAENCTRKASLRDGCFEIVQKRFPLYNFWVPVATSTTAGNVSSAFIVNGSYFHCFKLTAICFLSVVCP